MTTVMDAIRLGSKTAPEIRQAVEMLGLMNDRHDEALGNQDKKTLRALAKEYEAIGCPRLASEIRTEARSLRRTRSRTAKRGDVISGPATPAMAV